MWGDVEEERECVKAGGGEEVEGEEEGVRGCKKSEYGRVLG